MTKLYRPNAGPSSPSQTWLGALASGGAFLRERRSLQPLPTPAEVIEERRRQWCEAAAQGDEAAFAWRLERDRISDKDVNRLLGDGRWPEHRRLPFWVRSFAELHRAAQGIDRSSISILHRRRPIPFEDILAPYVVVAERRLWADSTCTVPMAPEVHARLSRHLLLHLSALAAPTLAHEFDSFISQHRRGLGRVAHRNLDARQDRLYRAFCSYFWSIGQGPFYERYPVLARWLTRTVDTWVASHRDWAKRLQQDHAALSAELFNGAPLEKVSSIRSGISDHHLGHWGVLIVRFDNRHSAVYKPHGLEMDTALTAFAAELDELGAPYPLQPPATVARPGYGWMEHIEAEPSEGFEAAEHFYERSGALGAVLQILETSDGHDENVIASGVAPVLVGGATVVHHRPAVESTIPEGPGAHAEFSQRLSESPLRGGLLPLWALDRSGNGKASDISGLGSAGLHETEQRDAERGQLHRDELDPGLISHATASQNHIPTERSEAPVITDHADAFQRGYRAMWHFLRAHEEAVSGPAGALRHFAGCHARYFLRPTHIYRQLLEAGAVPTHLACGRSMSLHFEPLLREVTVGKRSQEHRALVDSELHALHHRYVPYFDAAVDQTTVGVPGGKRVPGVLLEPSLVAAKARLHRGDAAELDAQMRVLSASLFCRRQDAPPARSTPKTSWKPTPNLVRSPLEAPQKDAEPSK